MTLFYVNSRPSSVRARNRKLIHDAGIELAVAFDAHQLATVGRYGSAKAQIGQ